MPLPPPAPRLPPSPSPPEPLSLSLLEVAELNPEPPLTKAFPASVAAALAVVAAAPRRANMVLPTSPLTTLLAI